MFSSGFLSEGKDEDKDIEILKDLGLFNQGLSLFPISILALTLRRAVLFLFSIQSSLSLLELLFGLVGLGSNPPPFLYSADQYFSALSEKGRALLVFLVDIPFFEFCLFHNSRILPQGVEFNY